VRWYTTAGIVDAPGRDGHSAAYGRRHLLQLLYTRQAQASGTALDIVREQVSGLTDKQLTKAVRMDLSLVPADLGDISPRPETPFWSAAPVTRDAVATMPATAGDASRDTARSGGMSSVAASVDYVVHIGPLALSLTHPPTESELIDLTNAATTFLSAVDPSILRTTPFTRIPARTPIPTHTPIPTV
jgi:hypothetical protein